MRSSHVVAGFLVAACALLALAMTKFRPNYQPSVHPQVRLRSGRLAAVPIPDTQEESALMRKTGPASRVNAPFLQGGMKEPLFKPQLQPKTRATTANEFLYGGKLKVPPARR